MEVRVRKAVLEDAVAIAQLLKELGWFEYLTHESFADTAARVERHLELCHADNSHSVYVAENPLGEVLGYASVHWLPYLFLKAPEGYLSELFVQAEERGKGVGALLFEAIKTEAIARGCSRLMLVNSRSRESYQRGFYKKLGWEERETVANFIYKF